MSLRDNFKIKQQVFIQSPVESYTLNDLRNDDEFNERTTRFLQSIGEGKTADDLFGYFRGMEYNLGDATQAMFQTKKFDDQQKDDYLYLKNKFDNANVGDWVEWARTSADIGQEILTDPTMIASALFIPWTGGTSLAARLSAGKAVQTGLKVAANKTVQEGTKKGFAAMPGQVLKKPLTPIQTHALVGAEGMAYGSSYDFLRQNREINVGQREDYNLEETLTTGALGGVLGYGASFGIRHIANTPSYLRSIEERRLAKIDHNESYKDNVLERINQAALYGMTLFTKPTSSFLLKAKKSKTLSDLIKVFRYDAEKPILAEAAGTTPRMKESYNETLNEFIGTRLEGLKDILNKYNLYELGQRDIVGSFRKKTLLKSYRLSEKTNNDLTKYLRTGNKVGLDDNIVKAGDEVRGLLNEILEQARKEGLNVGEVENFFPRVWLLDSMKNNKAAFINQIRQDEKLNVAEAIELWKRMTNLNQVDGTSAANLASIRAKRKLLNIDDSKYSQFLDNNVENVLQDYIFQAGKLITRKKLFGENLEEFRNRFVNKIDDELGGTGLGKVERDKLENLYLFTTGQRGYINNPVGRFLSDTIAVTTQTSLLPFAAITSLSEIGVPLLRGADTKVYAKAVWKGLADSADEWWNGVQTALGREGAKPEGRSLNRRELNAFNRSIDMAREDRATAIYGQAMGRTATKIQNVFFKSIFLHDWTRFVQLVSYDTGKGIIYRNLDELANKKLNKQTTARLTDELNELGVDVNKGIEWIKNGANHTDDFYMQDVRRGAARYTDEVIMNPTVASNQKPLIHSHPATKWSFGLLGFPTAFSNTVLKNAVREISKDLRNSNRLATPKVLSGILVMTAAGLVGNTLRTGGRNLQEYREGEKPLVSSLTARAEGKETGLINDALVRSGLYGPFEYYVRTQEAQRYQNNVTALLTSLTGPAVGDILDYVRASQYRGATLEAVFRKAPFITVLRSQFPETYQETLKAIREADKEAGPQRPDKEVVPFATGGLVSGPDVPFTKEDPADRINPLTGEPYRENFVVGGIAGKLSQRVQQRFGKTYKADELAEQMERLATTRDPEGSTKFVSPSLKVMIERGPQNIKGPQVLDWLKANTNKGIRPDEVKELGIESYVIRNPEATLGEVVEAVSPRQTRLTKAIKGKDKVNEIDFETAIAEYDPINNSPLWSSIRESIEDEIKDGQDYGLYSTKLMMRFGKEQHPDIVGDVSKLSDLSKEKQDDLIDKYARFMYKEDPYEIIRPKTENLGNTFAFGNEDIGYTLFINGKKQHSLENMIGSNSEARITLNRLIREEFDDLDFGGEAYRHKEYIDENLPGGDNYREVVFELADAKVPSNASTHFDEENYLAHALVRDRKLSDNTKTLHIDELQSDLHKKAKDFGYDTPENRLKLENKIKSLDRELTPDKINDMKARFRERAKNHIVSKDEKTLNYSINRLVDNLGLYASEEPFSSRVKDFNDRMYNIALKEIYDSLDNKSLLETPSATINKQLNMTKDAIELKKTEPLYKDFKKFREQKIERDKLETELNYLLPDYPYKENWHTVVINRLLAEAIDEGYDAISLSPAKVLSDRYASRYDELYSNLYDKKVPSYLKKLARRYKGKFEKGKLDIDDTFGMGTEKFLAAPETGLDRRRKLSEVNILRITPEMREMLEKEGLQAFNEGGLVSRLGFAEGGNSNYLDLAFDFIAKHEDEKLYNQMKAGENPKLQAYLPTPDDVATIGWGRTRGVTMDTTSTLNEETPLTKEEINLVNNEAIKSIGQENFNSLSDRQKASVISLIYNVGITNFNNSKAKNALIKKDYNTFKKEAFDPEIGFVKQDGKVLKGLQKRRLEEQLLFEQ